MMIRITCLLFLAHLLAGISCNQEFSTEPANVEVTPGHNTTLDCTISNLKGQCRWQKDGKPVGMFPGKYEMRREGEGEGDCSLSVLNVDLKFDDGLWECQVTSSSFQAQDSLVSRKARLTVRVPPEMITIQYSGSSVVEGGIITLVEDKQENIVCITRFSNPAPIISWRLGGNIYPSISQENFTEAVPSKFRSEGTLALAFTQKNQGERLECVVSHPAYLEGDGSTHVEIDVLYKPRVEITRVSNSVVEEGIGSVALTCSAVGNPPPRVLWTRFGEDTPQYVETLEFNPVTRQNAGSYICSAENTIGKSNQETTQVDVLYAPEIVSLSPRETVLVMARNQTKLTCTASGNPEPKYQWLQLQQSQVVKKRSVTPDLILDDVNYEDQGEYVCEAVNMIGGEKRVVRSEVVKVEVEGVPLVTRMVNEVVAVSGRDVRLEAEFCSDPLPLRNTWEWEDISLPAGTEIERSGTKYSAELEEHPSNKDCYISRLTLKGVGQADSRSYTLNVENMHGTDLAPVKLAVRDPVSMASVIGVVIALLIIFVLLSIILLVAYKKQKLCFKDGDLDALEKSKSNKYSSYNGIDVKDISPIKEKQTAFPPSTKNGDIGVPIYQLYVPSSLSSLASHNSTAGQTGLPPNQTGYNPNQTSYNPSQTGFNPTGLLSTHNGFSSSQNIFTLSQNGISGPTSLSIKQNGYPSLQPKQNGGGPPSLQPRSNFQIYNQLQYPSTSNWGSMKRGKGNPRSSRPSSVLPSPTSLPDLNQDTAVQYIPNLVPANN